MLSKKKGMMFVLSSPSGAGKTTLTKKLAENNKNFAVSISHTTRKPRPNEINGKANKLNPEIRPKVNLIFFIIFPKMLVKGNKNSDKLNITEHKYSLFYPKNATKLTFI